MPWDCQPPRPGAAGCLPVGGPEPPLEGSGNRKQVRRLTSHCRDHLHESQLGRLAVLADRLANNGALNLERWWTATDLTADRAGLLLCNDIDLAARMIGADAAATGVPAEERVKHLVQFMCSLEYFELREALGLTIDRLAAKGESRAR